MENKNRIWPDGESLTWSTITNLLIDGDLTEVNLKNCTLDLTDALYKAKEKVAELEKKLADAKGKVGFLEGNLDACIEFGIRNINGYTKTRTYLHDVENKTVTVKKYPDKIIVKETFITL